MSIPDIYNVWDQHEWEKYFKVKLVLINRISKYCLFYIDKICNIFPGSTSWPRWTTYSKLSSPVYGLQQISGHQRLNVSGPNFGTCYHMIEQWIAPHETEDGFVQTQTTSAAVERELWRAQRSWGQQPIQSWEANTIR